jgi:hypothetical protein
MKRRIKIAELFGQGANQEVQELQKLKSDTVGAVLIQMQKCVTTGGI